MTRGRKPEPVPARLNRLSHDEGECRIWDGHLSDGYGRINIAGQFLLVHRVSYEIVKGPIPAGMEIDHTCFNRACIAVDHLRVATRRENAAHLQGAPAYSLTGIRGVSVSDQCGRVRYRATVIRGGEKTHLGMYDTAEEAGLVAEAARLELFGEDFGR